MKILFFFCIFFIFLTSCSTNGLLQENLTPHNYEGNDAIIFSDDDIVTTLKFDRYRLNSMEISGDTILLSVSFSGGCRDHEFRLIADQYFEDGEKVIMKLSHKSNFDPCEAYSTESISFNLLPLKDAYIKKYNKDYGTIILTMDEKSIEYNF